MLNPLTEPECSYGYPWSQLEREMDAETVERLNKFMVGQTMAICEALPQREWRGEGRDAYLEVVGPPLCDRPHGGVVYKWDVERFFAGLPVID